MKEKIKKDKGLDLIDENINANSSPKKCEKIFKKLENKNDIL